VIPEGFTETKKEQKIETHIAKYNELKERLKNLTRSQLDLQNLLASMSNKG
jgi:hypothetical protein